MASPRKDEPCKSIDVESEILKDNGVTDDKAYHSRNSSPPTEPIRTSSLSESSCPENDMNVVWKLYELHKALNSLAEATKEYTKNDGGVDLLEPFRKKVVRNYPTTMHTTAGFGFRYDKNEGICSNGRDVGHELVDDSEDNEDRVGNVREEKVLNSDVKEGTDIEDGGGEIKWRHNQADGGEKKDH